MSTGCSIIILKRNSILTMKEKERFMTVAVKEDYQMALNEQRKEVQGLVLAGLEQIKEGKTKEFNAVCDRLEKKYK
mgnify:FL=1